MSGFSDPYCLLTILEDEEESRTRRSRAKPSKSVVKDAASDDKLFQTDVKKQTLNPIWNQTFILWVPLLDLILRELLALLMGRLRVKVNIFWLGLNLLGKHLSNVSHEWMFVFKVWKSSLQLLPLSVPESLATSLVPASTWRCGEQRKTQTRALKITSITALRRSLQCCVFYRDKDEEVSLSQKFEEIKSNFNSLRRWGSLLNSGRSNTTVAGRC